MGTTFTTAGRHDGCCGHEHRNLALAAACLGRYSLAARQRPACYGRPDRQIVARDASHRASWTRKLVMRDALTGALIGARELCEDERARLDRIYGRGD